MKINSFKPTRLLLALTLLLSSLTIPVIAFAGAAVSPDLGSASSYALLGVTISNTNPLFIFGDVGSGSGGQTLQPSNLVGTNHLNDAAYSAANNDLGLAIANANAQQCTVNEAGGADIGGQSLNPGVYCFPGAGSITGTLNLIGNGPHIFKFIGTFNTAANAVITVSNGAQFGDVFWVVGGASTLGANTNLVGTVMSPTAITVGANSNINGRILSQTTATVSTDTIRVPPLVAVVIPPVVMQNLVLTSVCSADPLVSRNWLVHNPNNSQVNFSYLLEGTTQNGIRTINGNSDVPITTNTAGTNTLDALVNGSVQATAVSTATTCPTTPPVVAPPVVTPPVVTPPTGTTTTPCVVTPAITLATDATAVSVFVYSPALGASLIPNGNLIIHATLPNCATGTGTWNFNLGGKTYTINGNGAITYTATGVPVGTYKLAATFVPNAGPRVDLGSVTVTVPTVTGGQLPNTATPWYNLLLIGAALMLIGAFSWRSKRLHG